MITRDDLIVALKDFYFSATIDGTDHRWEPGEEGPDLHILGVKWLEPVGIGKQYLREWFYENSEEEILNALKDNLPIKFEITSEFSINDDDQFKVAEIDVIGILTIHKVLNINDTDVEIDADIKYANKWTHR